MSEKSDARRDRAPARPAGAAAPDGLESYNRVAETVGMMPSLRLKDNLLQLVCVVVGTLLGVVIGFVLARREDHSGEALVGFTAAGGALGFIVFGVLSGLVLMVLGWVRAAGGWRKGDRG